VLVGVQYSSEEEEEGLDDALSQLNKKKKVETVDVNTAYC